MKRKRKFAPGDVVYVDDAGTRVKGIVRAGALHSTLKLLYHSDRPASTSTGYYVSGGIEYVNVEIIESSKSSGGYWEHQLSHAPVKLTYTVIYS